MKKTEVENFESCSIMLLGRFHFFQPMVGRDIKTEVGDYEQSATLSLCVCLCVCAATRQEKESFMRCCSVLLCRTVKRVAWSKRLGAAAISSSTPCRCDGSRPAGTAAQQRLERVRLRLDKDVRQLRIMRGAVRLQNAHLKITNDLY